MAAQVKICGISSAHDYAICREAGARWVGMVYYPVGAMAGGAGKAVATPRTIQQVTGQCG